ncbi:MAG: hypothetical protein JST39_00390 [Bacteroidetes bacterium]|nr:hypothetical protein [Bacteroidota bacterium]
MQRILIAVACLCTGFHAPAQSSSSFEFWLSSIDKAAYKRTTYHVSAGRLEIKNGPYDFIYLSKDYEKDRLVFSTPLDTAAGSRLAVLGAGLYNDSLKKVYSNTCIIDGLIFSFSFEWAGREKTTTVSNFYLARVAPFIDFINGHVPYKYSISYPRETLERLRRSCPPDLIVH